MWQSCSNGKQMYKEVCHMREVVAFLIRPREPLASHADVLRGSSRVGQERVTNSAWEAMRAHVSSYFSTRRIFPLVFKKIRVHK